ncbi:hypothetical protein EBO23_04275 [Micrococcus luteus]|uniref:hypothetical protein n=1 Tax=Micrococcus luteus TaxID=1270 RepID=UPI000BF8D8FD|nr:hypothetical protein [Micrococcus luteus]MCT2324950.1 hypothetical protein [Micrococcus luteus]MCV7733895.1 hypothetical protein [Micrococcus luteus]PFH05011.1 hypothetical protein BX598_2431 [Micrococcaceae bacterium JKS001869]TPE34995.1 hypothetical protein EBO23_04275 [Micrococcus luteus]
MEKVLFQVTVHEARRDSAGVESVHTQAVEVPEDMTVRELVEHTLFRQVESFSELPFDGLRNGWGDDAERPEGEKPEKEWHARPHSSVTIRPMVPVGTTPWGF